MAIVFQVPNCLALDAKRNDLVTSLHTLPVGLRLCQRPTVQDSERMLERLALNTLTSAGCLELLSPSYVLHDSHVPGWSLNPANTASASSSQTLPESS